VAWWHALGIGRRRLPTPTLGLPTPTLELPPHGHALTAAATAKTASSQLVRTSDAWQNEAWSFYDTLGEFRYGVDWESAMLSRVRLYAAKLEPGQDEPVRANAGTAVDLMTAFGGGVAGRAQIMSDLTTQLAVPGEGYLIGEETGGIERWQVRSIDELRARGPGRYEVTDENSPTSAAQWRPLAAESLVTRIHRPHKRWHHLADSPARTALSTMREIELVNRYITAQYLSRLASAGVLVIPDEVTFPVREEFADADDPFMAEWIEIAAEGIRSPGTASAIVPIPIRVPAEYVDRIRHIDFTLKIDDKILEKRDSAIRRLASQMNVPAEVLLGVSDMNHWSAWQMDEAALKTNIAPDAELICQALTYNYLQPRLRAADVTDFASWVVWYDMSELALRPDRSQDAVQLYDRLEINGAALRRETGFSDEDRPQGQDLIEQALKVIIHTLPSGAGAALSELTGKEFDIRPAAPEPPDPAGGTAPGGERDPRGIDRDAPATRDDQPAPGDAGPPGRTASGGPDESKTRAREDRLISQARAPHALRFKVGQPGELLHPAECTKYAYSCPFTHAAVRLDRQPRPGRSGTYAARLDPFGRLVIGQPLPLLDTTGYVITRSSSHAPAHSRR